MVVFAECAVLCCAGGVKVTKSSEAEAVSVGKRFEAIFYIKLGLSVGVDWRLWQRLYDRKRLRFAISRAG